MPSAIQFDETRITSAGPGGVSRRALLAGGAALTGAVITGIGSVPALAQSQAHRLKVGDAEVIVLSDGIMDQPTALMMPGRETAEIAATFKAAGAEFAGLTAQLNVAVVRVGTETILIDAGGGTEFLPSLGKLEAQLTAAGITPDAITRVIFTHAHPDHFWGLVDPLTGDSAYEKAVHVMAGAERDFWLQADVETRVPEAFKGMAAGTHRRLKAVAARVTTARPGDEVVPGLQLVDTGGHTPGHVSVLLRSGGEQLLIGGDVLTQSVISFARPEWRWGPDLDSDRAVASRRRILDQLATDRVRLLGYHLPWPGVGRVERAGTAYRYVAG